jgi:hypothetical protein
MENHRIITEADKCWLAGYLEGEGSFVKGPPSNPGSPIIQVCSTDEDIIAKAADLFGVKYHKTKRKTNNQKHKTVWVVKRNGTVAVEIMEMLQPLMGKRRQSQIQKAIDSCSLKYRRLTRKHVLEIRHMCETSELTQKQIADLFKVSRETVNKIRNFKFHSW